MQDKEIEIKFKIHYTNDIPVVVSNFSEYDLSEDEYMGLLNEICSEMMVHSILHKDVSVAENKLATKEILAETVLMIANNILNCYNLTVDATPQIYEIFLFTFESMIALNNGKIFRDNIMPICSFDFNSKDILKILDCTYFCYIKYLKNHGILSDDIQLQVDKSLNKLKDMIKKYM